MISFSVTEEISFEGKWEQRGLSWVLYLMQNIPQHQGAGAHRELERAMRPNPRKISILNIIRYHN